LSPEHYHAVNGVPPMGGHAWWKYNPEFWTRFFRMPPPAAGQSQAVSSP
jgi:hypothetical protein